MTPESHVGVTNPIQAWRDHFKPMHTDLFVGQATATNGKLSLFSVYADFSASARARWAASAIVKMAGRRWQSSSEMWKLDSLISSGPIRNMSASDATNADVLVVAVSSLEQRPLELIQWLDSLAAWKNSRPVSGLLVGLLGDEEDKSWELDWTVNQLTRCAQQTDRDFIWRLMEKNAMDDSGWLAENVENLLARKPAAGYEAVF